ncbi:hypothetical protein [Xylanivirga thermophila]|uniref:hypothetical protein n=1 Tax=Xylanivirga thermophila TaxID=2496273 RepID=UPI00101BDDC0|nr:hypothetical protein [Xylanivirga thermophila]
MKNIEKQLKELEKKFKKADGHASFNELFNLDFMRKYTDFSSIEDFFEFGGFEVNTQEDYENLLQEELDKIVREKTKFKTWEEMLRCAGKEEMLRRLRMQGFDVK